MTPRANYTRAGKHPEHPFRVHLIMHKQSRFWLISKSGIMTHGIKNGR